MYPIHMVTSHFLQDTFYCPLICSYTSQVTGSPSGFLKIVTIQVVVIHPVSDQAHRCEVILDLTNQDPVRATVTLQYQHSKSLNSSQEANLALCADHLLL